MRFAIVKSQIVLIGDWLANGPVQWFVVMSEVFVLDPVSLVIQSFVFY